MIDPNPAFCMCGMTSRQVRKAPFTLTEWARSQFTSDVSRMVPVGITPAACTAIVGGPKVAVSFSIASPTAEASLTSAGREQGLSARSLNLLSNKDTSGSVAIENAYRGSLGCKPDGDSTAYSIPCAGNYGYSFFKPHHNPLPS